MTDAQKERLIEKMIDTPSLMTDEELELILNDQELWDIYEMSSSLSNAYIPQPEVVIRKEWKSFKPFLKKKPNFIHIFVKIAAIFLGILVLSSITGMVVYRLVNNDERKVIVKVDEKKIIEVLSSEEPKNTLSENKNEMTPSESQNNIYQTPREVNSKSVINDNMKESEEIDIEEYMRIQQARVDNELAVLEVQLILDEYNELIPLIDSLNIDNSLLQAKINNLTIQ